MDLDKALSHARTAVRLAPTEANYWDTLAQICDTLGFTDEAQRAREKTGRAFRRTMRCLYYVAIFFILHAARFRGKVRFVDATAAAGISFQHVDGRTGEKFLIETLGSGGTLF